MRRSVIAMLLVVAELFTIHYAAAEDIDLSSMSTRDLQKLKERISVELKNRPEEEPEDETERRKQIAKQYDEWVNAYDFDSILADIGSGNHGLTEDCAAVTKEKAESAKALLENCHVDHDPFTNEFRIVHSTLNAFGKDCQVYPFIDENGLNLIVGFPYSDSFHYDQIFLKFGDDIDQYDRFDNNSGFDIQFEMLNDESWEYSTLSGFFMYDSPLEAVSFREDGSVRKENYMLNENETSAVSDLASIYDIRYDIHSRILHWELYGE